MLYVIGGLTRCGKSLLAERVITVKPMPLVSIDWIRGAIFRVSPEVHARSKQGGTRRRQALAPAIADLVRNAGHFWNDSLIEGDDIRPADLARVCNKHDIETKAVFLGRSEVDLDELIRLESSSPHAWLHMIDEDLLNDIPRIITTASARLEKQCAKAGYPYIDMSKQSFEAGQDKAFKALLPKSRSTRKSR